MYHIDLEKGDLLLKKNVRVVRPGCGLFLKYYNTINGTCKRRYLEQKREWWSVEI